MYVSGTYANAYVSQLQSGRSTTPKTSDFQSVLDNCTQRDRVDISSEGASLAERMCNAETLLGVSPREDGCIHLEDLQAWYRENSAALGSKITGLLANSGVDTSQPIDLTLDYQGQIRVANDHPDKEKIEKILAENPEVRNKFAQLTAMGNLIEGAEEYQKFAEEYARNPQAAVEKYAHLFSSIKEAFTLRLENGTLSEA